MSFVSVLGLFLLLLSSAVGSLFAADDVNEQCLMCHEDQSLKNQAGRSLFVKKELVENSVHGRSGVSCVSCHADLESVKDFPHAEKLAKVNCASCHDEGTKAVRQQCSRSCHGRKRSRRQ